MSDKYIKLAKIEVNNDLEQAVCLRNMKKFDQAKKILKKALSQNPLDFDIRYQYIVTLLCEGEIKEAQTEITRAFRDFPNNKELILAQFQLYIQKEQFNKAYSVEKDLLKAYPELLYTYTFLSRVCLYKKRPDLKKAEQYAKEALRLAPEDEDALVSYGIVLNHKKKYTEAIKILENSLKIDPNNIDALLTLAMSYYLKGDSKKATSLSREALRMDPNDYEIMQQYFRIKSSNNPLLWIIYRYRLFMHRLGWFRFLFLLFLIVTNLSIIIVIIILPLWLLEKIILFAIKKQWIR